MAERDERRFAHLDVAANQTGMARRSDGVCALARSFGFSGMFNRPHVLTDAEIEARVRHATDHVLNRSMNVPQ